MWRKLTTTILALLVIEIANAQQEHHELSLQKWKASVDFLDAALSSVNAFTSLILKENYRSRVISYNNPTSTGMGFSLEAEIQAAMQPLLLKVKERNAVRITDIITSILNSAPGSQPGVAGVTVISPVFSAVVSLAGNLAIQEKKITRSDLDSFLSATGKFFYLFEKLHQANNLFVTRLEQLIARNSELLSDLREYILDMVVIIEGAPTRESLKQLPAEQIFLKYLDHPPEKISFYPADGIKSAKDITYSLRKLYREYLEVYEINYMQIREVLLESRSLGRKLNISQSERALRELEALYLESRQSDALSLRLQTLSERLNKVVETERGLIPAVEKD